MSANTKSVTSKIKEQQKKWNSKTAVQKMASTEVTSAPSQDRNPLDNSNCDVSNAFETVAEALHLQWSVIGKISQFSDEVHSRFISRCGEVLIFITFSYFQTHFYVFFFFFFEKALVRNRESVCG